MPSCVEPIQLQTMPITWHIPGWASVICWANCQFHTSRANITFGCVDATSGWANATSDRANARLCWAFPAAENAYSVAYIWLGQCNLRWANSTSGWANPTSGWAKATSGWAKTISGWAKATSGWANATSGWTNATSGWANATSSWAKKLTRWTAR